MAVRLHPFGFCKAAARGLLVPSRSPARGETRARRLAFGRAQASLSRGVRAVHGGHSHEGPRSRCVRARLEADRARARPPVCGADRHLGSRCLQAFASSAPGTEIDQPSFDSDSRRTPLSLETQWPQKRAVRPHGVGAQKARRLVHAPGAGPAARGPLSPRASVGTSSITSRRGSGCAPERCTRLRFGNFDASRRSSSSIKRCSEGPRPGMPG